MNLFNDILVIYTHKIYNALGEKKCKKEEKDTNIET